MNNQIVHLCSPGDIILVALSRRHPTQWTSVVLVEQNYVLETISAPDGPQTIRKNLVEFTEHENKPLGLFRFKDHIYIDSVKKFNKFMIKPLRPSWFNRVIKKEEFLKNNKIDITSRTMLYFNLLQLGNIEHLGKFVRLI